MRSPEGLERQPGHHDHGHAGHTHDHCHEHDHHHGSVPQAHNATALISARSLMLARDGRTILADIDIDIGPGEIVTVIEIAMNKQVDGRYKNAAALRDAIRAFRYGEEPEVVEEYDEADADGTPEGPSSDATAVAKSPPVASTTGTQKAAPFRSYGRTGTGSVPPSAAIRWYVGAISS